MFKIYLAHTLQAVWDFCIILSVLYGVGWFLLGPDISKIVNGIGIEIIRGYFG